MGHFLLNYEYIYNVHTCIRSHPKIINILNNLKRKKKLIFFLIKDIRILLFLDEYYKIKTDIVSYYLLLNFSTLQTFLHKQ